LGSKISEKEFIQFALPKERIPIAVKK